MQTHTLLAPSRDWSTCIRHSSGGLHTTKSSRYTGSILQHPEASTHPAEQPTWDGVKLEGTCELLALVVVHKTQTTARASVRSSHLIQGEEESEEVAPGAGDGRCMCRQQGPTDRPKP